MDYTRDDIRALLRKQLDGSLTDTERESLRQWGNAHPDNREVLERISKEAYFMADMEAFGSLDDRTAPITAHVRKHRPVKRRSFRIVRWLPYAAAILVAIAGAWLLLDNRQQTTGIKLASADVAPGGNRATLTLADGRTIDLSEAHEGIVIEEEAIKYNNGDSLVSNWVGTGDPSGTENGNLTTNYYMLTTPKGGTYQVTLPDGSNVWLNANSTLRYPSRFDGEERVVELTGEAYFDVRHQTPDKKHQARPRSFKVITSGQTVQVLGTQFNIAAYADEPETKTTLVTGSVRVAPTTGGGSPVIIKPGEQSVLRDAQINIQQVNVSAAMAWKDGRFTFDDKPFDQIMREIGRWYNLEIQYEGPVPYTELFGDAFRNEDLSFVLKLLDNGGFSYTLDGRTLTIKTKAGGHR